MQFHKLVISCLLILLFSQNITAEPIKVELLKNNNGHWQLLRNGDPYFIKGAGGDGSKDLLAASGANTFRTWGVGAETGQLLDLADSLGLTVVVGHWLGHKRHGFDYNDPAQLKEQFERIRQDVLTYKNHPALLLWGVGNEMEGFKEGGDSTVWNHVQKIAAMIKELDPNHPTMSVTADIGGKRVESVHNLCPDIDIMGINTYGGMPSVPERYRKLGGTKPIIFTEFGPPGTWEIEMTSFGVPPELNSTQKAQAYKNSYNKGCLESGGLCLGSFAFTWGFKVEATPTWYGMFLPNGDKLASVDAMTEMWSGQLPTNLCPEIKSFSLRGQDVVNSGDTVYVDLDIVDPENTAVNVEWSVRGEVADYFSGGDEQELPFALDNIIVESSNSGATLVMPGGGIYRLFMTASDGNGGGATANVPIKVEGPSKAVRLKMPVTVYADNDFSPWTPSGWMGTHDALTMDAECNESPHSGTTCIKFIYDEPGMWVGVTWQHPSNDWGDKLGGFDLTGAKKLTFWARGETGNETVDFGVGIIGSDKKHHDSTKKWKKGVKLKKEWKQYTIKLDKKSLTQIKTPFAWTLGGQGRSVTFYVDDIRFEK